MPGNLESLRRVCSEVLRDLPAGLPRSLASLPHMATDLKWEAPALHFFFPPNIRNTAQDLEREQANPHLLQALRQRLPGLQRILITFEGPSHHRPEEVLKQDPAFQRLLAETGGEVVELRRV